jgi:hypothetical protein
MKPAFQSLVSDAARAMWFAGVREWPLNSVPAALTRFGRVVLDEAWAQIQRTRGAAIKHVGSQPPPPLRVEPPVRPPEMNMSMTARLMGVSRESIRRWDKYGWPQHKAIAMKVAVLKFREENPDV